MATIYDSNSNICGIVVKGYSNENIETTDSSLSGKWSKYINCNLFKKDDYNDIMLYIPLSFNLNRSSSSAPNQYFNYSFSQDDYASYYNNEINYNSCVWFNCYDLMTWMNDNGKWSSLWTDDQLNRGYGYLSSHQGVNHSDTSTIAQASPSQDNFLKPNIVHTNTGYAVNYHYYVNSYKLNSTTPNNISATSYTNNISSTDIHITADAQMSFKLGYNGIISGIGLDDYIKSVDTTDPSGRPFWQRFFFVSIKGGFDSNESYNNKRKANLKLCTFDQNTGLENESNSNLSSIPIKYKKLRNNVYLIQDDHFKTFQTYEDGNYFSVNISLPIIMNTSTANFITDRVNYIQGNNDHSGWVYTGTNNIDEYVAGKWTNKLYTFCSGENPYTDVVLFYNSAENKFVRYYSEATKYTLDEINTKLSTYKYMLYENNRYWVTGNQPNVTWTNDLSGATIFNTSAEAEAVRQSFTYNQPNVGITDVNKTGVYTYMGNYNMNATMFSSTADANAIISKMYETAGSEGHNYHPSVYTNGHESYNTRYFTNIKSDSTTSSVNMSDIPLVKLLSLNYFIRPV